MSVTLDSHADRSIPLNGQTTELSSDIKYLGSTILANGQYVDDVKRLSDAAQTAFVLLRGATHSMGLASLFMNEVLPHESTECESRSRLRPSRDIATNMTGKRMGRITHVDVGSLSRTPWVQILMTTTTMTLWQTSYFGDGCAILERPSNGQVIECRGSLTRYFYFETPHC